MRFSPFLSTWAFGSHPTSSTVGARLFDGVKWLGHVFDYPPQSGAEVCLLTYLLTYLLTPWYRVLPEQLTDLQLVKKFPAFHRTWRFITALTSIRHLSLSWASPILSTSHLLEIHPNIIHPSMPRFPQWSPSLWFPQQDPIHLPLLTHMCHMPSLSYSFRFYHPYSSTHYVVLKLR